MSVDQRNAGYPKVAAFEDLDPSFLIARRFSWLRNCSLLYLQDELSELESRLIALNKWEYSDGDDKRLVSRRRDWAKGDSPRKELIEKINSKLKEYGKIRFAISHYCYTKA